MSENDENVTHMPAEQFDELMRRIDEPDDASGILAALQRSVSKIACAHCGRKGHAFGQVNDTRLCHPNVGMDCYRLVTVYSEPIGARLPGGALDGKPAPIPSNRIPW